MVESTGQQLDKLTFDDVMSGKDVSFDMTRSLTQISDGATEEAKGEAFMGYLDSSDKVGAAGDIRVRQ